MNFDSDHLLGGNEAGGGCKLIDIRLKFKLKIRYDYNEDSLRVKDMVF